MTPITAKNINNDNDNDHSNHDHRSNKSAPRATPERRETRGVPGHRLPLPGGGRQTREEADQGGHAEGEAGGGQPGATAHGEEGGEGGGPALRRAAGKNARQPTTARAGDRMEAVDGPTHAALPDKPCECDMEKTDTRPWVLL